MLKTGILSLISVAILSGGWRSTDDVAPKAKDPPKRLEGVVKKVETDKRGNFLTIGVKEKQPTDMEDIFVDVEKLHRFRVTDATKVLGTDGKPAKRGLHEAEVGSPVRVEFTEDRLIEIKILPHMKNVS